MLGNGGGQSPDLAGFAAGESDAAGGVHLDDMGLRQEAQLVTYVGIGTLGESAVVIDFQDGFSFHGSGPLPDAAHHDGTGRKKGRDSRREPPHRAEGRNRNRVSSCK